MKLIIKPDQSSAANFVQVVKPIRGKAKFIKKKQISQFVYEMVFEMIEPQKINFRSGQYIALEISPTIRRQYSISNAPQIKNRFEIVLDIKPNGVGVNFLMNLKPSDEIKFIGQIGLFVLPQKLEKNLYFISTGTGLAPLKSMIEDLINQNKFSQYNIYVIFGTRYINDIFYKELFDKYLSQDFIKEYKIFLSRAENVEDFFEEGYVTKYFANMLNENLQNAQFFICGGNEMIKSLEALLLEKGVDEERIIYEKFY